MNMKREIVKLSVETDYKLKQSFKEEDRFRENILLSCLLPLISIFSRNLSSSLKLCFSLWSVSTLNFTISRFILIHGIY